MNQTFHRGAAVSQRVSLATYYGTTELARVFRGQQYQMETHGGLTAKMMAAAGNKARQRNKKPITRYGVKR